MTHSSRHYGYDNIKGILIICVVFGHFLEICDNSTVSNTLYLLIYSFHMPAFLFFSGFFAKCCWRSTLRPLLWYGCFQILYRLFAQFVLHIPNALDIHKLLFLPYWLLWYLPVLTYCHLLLPLQQRFTILGKTVFLLASFLISLLCGYCRLIGYPFSLSRFLVFCPYFLLGHLAGSYRGKIAALAYRKKYLIPLLSVCIVFSSLCLFSGGQITSPMLYGSYSYAIGYHPGIRLVLAAIAILWICLFLLLANTFLNQKVPILSFTGRHTLPIYLLHGFVVKYIGHQYSLITIPMGLLYTVISIALLGNSVFTRILCCPRWKKREDAVHPLAKNK